MIALHEELFALAAESEPDAAATLNRCGETARELLAALQAFLRAPSIGSDGPGSLTIVVQEFNLKAARAAIAKGEGRS